MKLSFLRIDSLLCQLIQLYHEGISVDDVVLYMAKLGEQILETKPNINTGWCVRKNLNRVWVVKGFYPDTKVPLKITIVDVNVRHRDSQHTYPIPSSYVMSVYVGSRTISRYNHNSNNFIKLGSTEIAQLEKYAADRETRRLLGADDMDDKYSVKKHRLMTPKGLKPLRRKDD